MTEREARIAAALNREAQRIADELMAEIPALETEWAELECRKRQLIGDKT